MLRTRSEVSLEIGNGGFAPDPLFPGRFSLACVTSIIGYLGCLAALGMTVEMLDNPNSEHNENHHSLLFPGFSRQPSPL